MASARRLLFLSDTLLLRIRSGSRHAGCRRSGVGDRPSEIAGKRRSELGSVSRKTRIVARQVGETIRRHAIAGVVELRPRRLGLRPQGQKQGATNSKRRNRAKPEKDFAGEPRHGPPAGPQLHFLRRSVAGWELARPAIWGIGHDRGLPSVRTIRTFCWGSPPSRKLGCGEQPIDDHMVALDAIVHELGAAFCADYPERGHLSLADAGRELDEHLPPVIEGAQWPPCRIVALDPIAKVQRVDVDAGGDRRRRIGDGVLLAQGNELVLGVEPRHGGHVGLIVGAQLQMVGPAVCVDDEIGDEIRASRLDQDMYTLGRSCPAIGIADDPAHGVAGGDGSGTDELLAGFERDVGDLAGCGVELIERAFGERINLDGVDVAGAGRFHACRSVGLLNARSWIGGIVRRGLGAGDRLELAWQRQEFRQFDDLHRLGRIGLQHRLPRGVIVFDCGRLPGRAGAKGGAGKQKGCEVQNAHQPSSFDQLRAWT